MNIAARVERQLMVRLAALIFLLYLLFAVDRGNIGFAGLQMTKALGLTAEVFGFGSGLFTLAYLLFQIPNAVLLRRVGGGRALALIACAWGTLSTTTAFVPNQTWFLVNRFLMGAAEAGFNAFVIYYINQMFPRGLRGFAVGLTLIAVPVSMVIASPLSGLLLNWRTGGLQGWQWMFIVEGLPSVVVGLLCIKLIPRNVNEITFLSSEEHAWLSADLGRFAGAAQFGMLRGLSSSLRNPVVWALGFILFTTVFGANVMLIWMPQMIRQMSSAGNVGVGFLNMLPWIALGIGCLVVSRVSDKVANRRTPLRYALVIAAAGFIIAAAMQDGHPAVGFLGLMMGAFGAGAAQGVFWALTMELVNGAESATAYAVITLFGNGSGVFAHPLIGKLHDVTGSYAGAVWALALFNVAAIATVSLLGSRRPRQSSTTPQPATD